MRPEARQALDQYFSRISQLNGGVNVEKNFTVDPSVQQTLESKIQESSEFLKRINIVPVPELQGEKIGLGISGMIAGRTDTSGGTKRQPRDVSTLSKTGYQLKKTNFDTFIGYDKVDLWAKFPDFQTRIQNLIIERCALDRIAIGFNGTSIAATTDVGANPLGEDVNRGWLYDMRTNNDARVMDEVINGTGEITVGTGGDYANLDALVMDAKHAMLPSWHRNRTDLVAIVGADILHDKYFEKVNKEEKPTEELALQVILASKRLGGLQAMIVPFFPENGIFVTPLSNLSLYYQDGKRRRHLKDEPELDRTVDYQSSNEGYVIEDYEPSFLLENIELIATDQG